MAERKSAAVLSAGELRWQAHEKWRQNDDIRALLEERRGYVTRVAAAATKNDADEHARFVDRVAQVDAQLRSKGAEDEIPAEPLAKLRRPARKAAAATADDGAGEGSGEGGDGSGA